MYKDLLNLPVTLCLTDLTPEDREKFITELERLKMPREGDYKGPLYDIENCFLTVNYADRKANYTVSYKGFERTINSSGFILDENGTPCEEVSADDVNKTISAIAEFHGQMAEIVEQCDTENRVTFDLTNATPVQRSFLYEKIRLTSTAFRCRSGTVGTPMINDINVLYNNRFPYLTVDFTWYSAVAHDNTDILRLESDTVVRVNKDKPSEVTHLLT